MVRLILACPSWVFAVVVGVSAACTLASYFLLVAEKLAVK